MVKFKWPFSKIAVQRMILLAMIGVISCGIWKGHQEYERKVSEYMNSLEYRRAWEASHDYHVARMKSNQRSVAADDDEQPLPADEPPADDEQN